MDILDACEVKVYRGLRTHKLSIENIGYSAGL